MLCTSAHNLKYIFQNKSQRMYLLFSIVFPIAIFCLYVVVILKSCCLNTKLYLSWADSFWGLTNTDKQTYPSEDGHLSSQPRGGRMGKMAGDTSQHMHWGFLLKAQNQQGTRLT